MPEVGSLTFQEGAGEGRTGDWGKVVTRYPYENVGMDHLLSMEYRNRKEEPYKNFGVCTYVKSSCRSYLAFILLGFERLFSQDIVL